MDISALVDALAKHAWILVASLVIGALVRALKSDTPLPTVPAAWRSWLALGLGIVAAVLDKILGGTPWLVAVVGGLAAAMLAIVGHETVVESLRNGREFFEPKPPSPDALAHIVPPAALLAFAVALGGCASLGGKGPAIEHGMGDVVECVLGHYLSGERDPVIIAETCAIADWHDVQAIIDAHKRAMAKDAECAPSGAK